MVIILYQEHEINNDFWKSELNIKSIFTILIAEDINYIFQLIFILFMGLLGFNIQGDMKLKQQECHV